MGEITTGSPLKQQKKVSRNMNVFSKSSKTQSRRGQTQIISPRPEESEYEYYSEEDEEAKALEQKRVNVIDPYST